MRFHVDKSRQNGLMRRADHVLGFQQFGQRLVMSVTTPAVA